MTATPPTASRIPWANSLRGAAALSVMLGHLMVALVLQQALAQWVTRIPEPADLTAALPLANALDALPFDLMAAGVSAFFLLSGLVITRSLRRYSRSGFVVGRTMRLLPTYAAAFLIGCLGYAMLAMLAGRAVPFSVAEVAAGLVPGADVVLLWPSVVNPVAWTLMVEITFYVLCAIWYRSMGRSRTLLVGIAVACVLVHWVAAATAWPAALQGVERGVHYIAPFLPILLIGVQVAAAGDRLRRSDVGVILVMFAAMLAMTQWQQNPIFVRDGGFVFTEVITVLGFLALWRWSGQRSGGPVFGWLADISYPLYCIHLMLGFAVVLGLVAVGVHVFLAQAAAMLACLGVATVLHHTVEAPTHRWGRRWAAALTAESPAVRHVTRTQPDAA